MGDLRQLPLPLPHEPAYASAEFLAAPSNEQARAWLANVAGWPSGRLLLWGEEGVGKTHLLHVWARGSGARILSAHGLRGIPPAPTTPLAIDDADAPAEEAALFHLLNAAGEARQPVLVAARTPAARWRLRLPDLASRVSAMTAVPIGAPEESLLDALLAKLLAERGLLVEPSMQAALRLRLPRSAQALREFVARLDRVSLAHGMRRVPRWLLLRIVSETVDADADGFTEDMPSGSSDQALV